MLYIPKFSENFNEIDRGGSREGFVRTLFDIGSADF